MNKITIAFDIDGTLRCNCTDTCNDANPGALALANLFHKYFKNVELHAWSGRGADYAWNFVRTHGMAKAMPQNRCHSKLEYASIPKMDIAIDDQHEFALAHLNLIVRMK